MTDTPWTPGPWERDGKLVIAQGWIMGMAHTEPDARLIAAAPEMARLVERMLLVYQAGPDADPELHPDVVALLSRIRGEA